jgi:hypothetical protein
MCNDTATTSPRRRRPDIELLRQAQPMPYLSCRNLARHAYDDDRRFRGVLNAWVEDNPRTGRARELTGADLTAFGLEPGHLPSF